MRLAAAPFVRRGLWALGLLAACAGRTAGAADTVSKWTVMVYMSGDNDLEPYIVSDIENELAATGSTRDVQVIALADRIAGYDPRRGDWTTTKLFHVTPGMTADSQSAVADWGERDFGDAQTLVDFVTWSRANYPAERYCLYFWGHGWSWHPGWVMLDVTNHNDTLDADELRSALPQLGFIDVVGYDGCNMASIEIDTLWHNHATALSHSQEWVSGEGLKYDEILTQLAANPDMTSDELAILTSTTATTDKTWSTVAVDERLEPLLGTLDQWTGALRALLDGDRAAVQAALAATQSFWEAPMDRDLYDLAAQVQARTADAALQTLCQQLMAAVQAVVLVERHQPRYENAHGITIYGPATGPQKIDFAYYRALDFAARTAWDDFLCVYLPQAGDVDRDCDSDLADLAALLSAYGTCAPQPEYISSADFDQNGCVDLGDLAALLGSYGT